MSMSDALDPAVIESLRQLTSPGEPDVLEEVLKIFLQEAPLRIDRLRTFLADGNIQEVQRAAHSLKGSAGNIGARQLHDLCRQVDEKGRAGELSGLAPLVDTLAVEFGKVEVEIHRLLKR
jgi:HPt (histidine-containing phosphotransfer) domain-containing protein